ncbi:iron (metal) dependent repressor, dtxr family protein [Chitinophaga parva]|uniref:Transcriptional regulator MntR n=1 Tax=Chitinophaga parva TaxID=2169414 RepID=A0A2T7BCU0_9BACT|nr:metal-dependent transcriptional regulator [Chitinophaga parva]PUZ22916.1 iron (metal) dependent repressor, dtxr family protein [Chitinophaga parva]
MMTLTEENYLKALFRISLEKTEITVKDIATHLELKMPTVNSMIQKLSEKKLVRYEKYKAIELTEKGRRQALHILRKHRLTELFLSEVMGLGWEEVHDIAEQIEHIQSDRFFDRIDEMLGHPKFDPHGEPIPDANGKLPVVKAVPLSSCTPGKQYTLSGVLNHETAFLKFLDALQLSIGATIAVKEIQPFDKSMSVVLHGKNNTVFSYTVCQNLLVM